MLIGAAKPDVHVVDVHGKKILFDANSLLAIEVSETILKELLKEGQTEQSFGGLLFSRDKPQYPILMSPSVRELVLNITHACNLACRYCFVRNFYPDQESSMSLEMVKEAIKLFDSKTSASVGFFGGEPMIAFPTIVEVVKYVQSRNKALGHGASNFKMTTNATLIDGRVAQYLKANNFSLIVSLDGDQTTHNAMRPLKKPGGNSFKETIDGLNALHTARFDMQRITLRSTFTGDGVDLTCRLAFLNSLVERGYGGTVAVEPACLTESACMAMDEKISTFSLEILEAQFTHIVLGESTWDICIHCAQRLRPSLEFLNITAGIDVKYSVSEGAQ